MVKLKTCSETTYVIENNSYFLVIKNHHGRAMNMVYKKVQSWAHFLKIDLPDESKNSKLVLFADDTAVVSSKSFKNVTKDVVLELECKMHSLRVRK